MRVRDCRMWRMSSVERWLTLLSLSAALLLLQGAQSADVAKDGVSGEGSTSGAAPLEPGEGEPDVALDGASADLEGSALSGGKLKEFPFLGMEGAGLLQMAEDNLGFKLSHLELRKVVPMLSDLQKHVHDHYLVTKAAGKQVGTSSLLKRVVSRKSKSRVLKTMKKFAPNTDDGELLQQLDAVMQLVNELHTHPENSMTEIVRNVGSALGFDIKDEDMEHIEGHFAWAQEFAEKLMPHLPKLWSGHISDEL